MLNLGFFLRFFFCKSGPWFILMVTFDFSQLSWYWPSKSDLGYVTVNHTFVCWNALLLVLMMNKNQFEWL